MNSEKTMATVPTMASTKIHHQQTTSEAGFKLYNP